MCNTAPVYDIHTSYDHGSWTVDAPAAVPPGPCGRSAWWCGCCSSLPRDAGPTAPRCRTDRWPRGAAAAADAVAEGAELFAGRCGRGWAGGGRGGARTVAQNRSGALSQVAERKKTFNMNPGERWTGCDCIGENSTVLRVYITHVELTGVVTGKRLGVAIECRLCRPSMVGVVFPCCRWDVLYLSI